MDLHRDLREPPDRRLDVHRVATEPIKLRDDKDVAGLHLLDELGEARPLHRRHAAGDHLRRAAERGHVESGLFDLADLVLGRPACRRDAGIGEDAGQGENPIRTGVRNCSL